MFTQCPKCQSVFMVSDKDIRAHEGLVRCGNCYSVFNSSWNLTDDPRSNLVDKPVSHDNDGSTVSQDSSFTFKIVPNDTVGLPVIGNRSDQVDEVLSDVDRQERNLADNNLSPDDDFLEPFPEPEMEDDDQSDKPGDSKDEHASLLYFDTDDEGNYDQVEDENPIDDVKEGSSILQISSNANESLPFYHAEPVAETDSDKDMATSMSMTEASMWPGSEVSFEDVGSDFDMPELDVNDKVAEPAGPEPDENPADLPDILIDELTRDDGLVEGLGGPELFNEPVGVIEDLSLTSDEQLAAIETEADEPFLPSLIDEDDEDVFVHADVSGNRLTTDDAGVTGDEAIDADQRISASSLPETVDEAFPLEMDDEDETGADSVFITSEKEQLDDLYVPISLHSDERDELLHGLDDFPEPGELSKLNYEDTMEINAMLEAANVSKQQIDSALLSVKAGDGDEIEEILLSSEGEVGLSDAIFISDGKEKEVGPEQDAGPNNKGKSRTSFLKNLLPLGWGRNKAWVEPAVLDTQETQLIQNLNRRKNKPEMPGWITKYSLAAAIGILIVTLLGQIGYFYMDKLVRIASIRPILKVGCTLAGCTVPPIQNIKDIEQLSSRLSPLAGSDGGFKIDSILVNRGNISQAFPALELTLTDRAGNIISRRVVKPVNYLADQPSSVMKPNEAVDISIRLRTPSIRVDGFELRPVSQNWLERSK